jgi:hypothetical protein
MAVGKTQCLSNPFGKCWLSGQWHSPTLLGKPLSRLDDIGQILTKNESYWPQDAPDMLAQFSVRHRCGVLGFVRH